MPQLPQVNGQAADTPVRLQRSAVFVLLTHSQDLVIGLVAPSLNILSLRGLSLQATGAWVGAAFVGTSVGTLVGVSVGAWVGAFVGTSVGTPVGVSVGTPAVNSLVSEDSKLLPVCRWVFPS